MATALNDKDLEERLEQLAKLQSVPVSRHAMLREIVREATKDLRRPNAWRKSSQPKGDAA
jgi:hypothetical protein